MKFTPPDPENRTFVSFENSFMDYVTLKGIKNRTGVKKDRLILFILKELIDNAVDIVERHSNSLDKNNKVVVPMISLSIVTENNF